MKKFLRVVLPRYNQVAVTIEMFCNLKELTLEELVGRLRAAEDRFDPSADQLSEKMPKLLLFEEEWIAKNKARMVDQSSSSGGKGGGGKHYAKKEKTGARDSRPRLTSMGTPRRRGKCKKCGIYGHWAKECKTPAKEERQEAAHAVLGENDSALLVAQVCDVVRRNPTSVQQVFLNQDRVFPADYNEGSWVLDTGATNHMTGCRVSLTELDEIVGGAVRFGDGSTVQIRRIGAVTIAGKNHDHRVLTEVYYIPSLQCNIVSLGQLEENGCRVEIDRGVLQVFERRQGVIQERALIKAERRNRLYVMKVNLTTPICLVSKISEEAWLWHARYGHQNFRSLRDLGSKKMVIGIPRIQHEDQVCDGCALGKHHRAPFPRASTYRASERLDLVHGDLCGHISPPTPGGKSFFLLIVDDYSRYMWLELLTTKAEAFQCFRKIKSIAEPESGRQLKVFRTDRGGEFNSTVFTAFCSKQGIKRNTTAPYTPQQNGVVERRNQTIVEMARCLLKSMKVPAKFWGEAVKVAVHILNRSPTKSLDQKTPFEAWFGRKPGVQHLRTFGCKAYAKVVGPGLTKLADRSVPGVFLGYEPGTKAYRVYDPIHNKLIVSRDVIFDEKQGWNWEEEERSAAGVPEGFTVCWPEDTDENPTIESSSGSDQQPPSSPAPSIPSPGGGSVGSPHTPQASTGSTHNQIQWATPPTGESVDSEGVPQRFRTIASLLEDTEEVQGFEYNGVCLVAAEEPRSVDEALKESCWREAMQAEMQAIEANRTWEVSELPTTHKAIGLKWVFKIKKDPEGKIVKHKARLVVKGYAQQQGVDFDEVFAPVARIETVRVLLALAAQGGSEVHHMDVKSAFLNGDLSDTVFVKQPPGFIIGQGDKVLKLRKALYGLR